MFNQVYKMHLQTETIVYLIEKYPGDLKFVRYFHFGLNCE